MSVPNTPQLSDFMDKSFWNRAEGGFGKALLVAAGIGAAAGAVFYLPAVLAFLAVITATVANIAISSAITLGIVAAIMNDSFRGLIGYCFRASVRWLTGFVVDLSPRAVLEDYIAELKAGLARLVVQIKNLGAQIKSLDSTISQNEQLRNESLELASRAKKEGKATVMVLQGRKAGRLSDSNMTLSQLKTKLDVIYRVLMKMKEGSDFSIADTENAVDMEIRTHTALKAGAGAMKEALAIIYGDPQKKAMFDMAMERLATEAAGYASEMSYAMEVSKNFLDSVDLQNGIFDEKALKDLEAWEKQVDTKILGPGVKQDILNTAYSSSPVIDGDVTEVTAPATNRVVGGSKYFEK